MRRYHRDTTTGLQLLVNQPRRKIYLVSKEEWWTHRFDKDDKEMVLNMDHTDWLKLLIKELLYAKCGVFRWLKTVVERGYTFVIVFVGDKQSGKTVAAIEVAELFNFLAGIDIPLEDIYNLSAADLFEKVNEKVKGHPNEFLRSGSTLMLDEGSTELNPTGHHVEDEIADLVQVFAVYGDAKINIVVTEPALRIMGSLKDLITKLFHMGLANSKDGHYGKRGWGLLKKVVVDDNKRTPKTWSEHQGIRYIPLDLETYLKYRPMKTGGTHKIAENAITRMRDRRERKNKKLAKVRIRQKRRDRE